MSKHLEQYLEQKNRWQKFFNYRPLSLDNQQDRQALARGIDSALSPENLHQDGEASPADARREYKRLTAVAKELKALDPTIEFMEADV
jgi:hypothetical protein